MKYYRTELWKQHRSATASTRKKVIAYIHTLVGAVGLAISAYMIFQDHGPALSSWVLPALAFEGILIFGIPKIWNIYWPLDAERKVKELAKLLNAADAEKFAGLSLEEVREMAEIKQAEYVAQIRAIEGEYKKLKLDDLQSAVREHIKGGERLWKGSYRRKMKTLYELLLEFQLADPGGINQYFKRVSE